MEKYRPRDLFDVVGNEGAMERLRGLAALGSMPNLILSGPPGCGKTTSVLALARALLGEDYVKNGVLEMNASDDRGIDVVREKIKHFAMQKVTLPQGRQKLIILDEADSMTEAAQQAMRRIMEIYSATTRFALACNQSTKIIEPIQSRCAIVRFTKLSDAEVLSRIRYVSDQEKVPLTDGGLEALVFTAEGDMRNALNNLQSTYTGFGSVTKENVFKVCDQPHPAEVLQVIRACLAQDWAQGYDRLAGLYSKGYSCGDIVGTLLRLLKNFDMREDAKIEFIKEVSVTHLRIVDGVQTLTQLGGMIARMCSAAENLKLTVAGA